MYNGQDDNDTPNESMEVDVVINRNPFSQPFLRANDQNRPFEHEHDDESAIEVQQHATGTSNDDEDVGFRHSRPVDRHVEEQTEIDEQVENEEDDA